MNYQKALETYPFEDNIKNIPLLNGLYIYFDEEHHDSGYNYIIIVGEAYRWKETNEKFIDGKPKRVCEETYKKIIARYSDVINIRNYDFTPFIAHGINLDYQDGELHLWLNNKDRFKAGKYLLSTAHFEIVQESEKQ